MAAQKGSATGETSPHRRPALSLTAPSSRTNTPVGERQDARDKSMFSVGSPRIKASPSPLALDASDHRPPPHSHSPLNTKNEAHHSPPKSSPSPPLIAKIGGGSGTHTPAESPAAATLVNKVTRPEFDDISRRLEATELSCEEAQSAMSQLSSTLEQLRQQLEAIATDTGENKSNIAAIMAQLAEKQASTAAQNEAPQSSAGASGIELPELSEAEARQMIAQQVREMGTTVLRLEQMITAHLPPIASSSPYLSATLEAAASSASQRQPPTQPAPSAQQKDNSSYFSCCCGPCWAGLLGSGPYQQHHDEDQS